MATVQAVKPVITPVDRLGLTISLAILIHGIIILGITFIEEDRSRARYDTMEIVLVQQKSPEPKEADLLAQANLEGGGEIEEVVNPAAPTPAPFPDPEPQITTPPPVESEPPQPPEPATTELEVPEPEPIKKELIETLAVEDETSTEPTIEKVETPTKERQVAEVKPVETEKIEPAPEKEENTGKKTDRKTQDTVSNRIANQ